MERRKLESAAAIYNHLRGLLSIPVGVMFILSALGNLAWGPLGRVWVFPVALVVAGAAYLGIYRHYNENYGRVTPSTRTQATAAVATVCGGAVIAAAVQMDWSFDLPVSGTAASFALVMLGYYAVAVGLRMHHAIILGSVLVTGLLPVWGDAGGDAKINIGILLGGAATIVTGIFDHGVLRRTFESAKDLDLGNGNAGA